MDTEVSSALSTLELDPRNKDARAAISRHTETGDADAVKLASALASARLFHGERGNVELCLELLDRELAITTDKHLRADLLSEKARLLFHEFARAEAAVECLREALELSQGHAAAGELLRRLQDEEAEWEKTAQTRIKHGKDGGARPASAPHFASAGELYLKYRPQSKEGETLLVRALEIDPRQKRAELLLERLYRAGGRLDDLAALYQRRVAAALTGDERAAAEVLAGEVALERASGAEALEHFKKALLASPAEPRALHRVVAALAEDENWAELAKVHEAALRVTKRGQGELALLVPLATVTWRKLGNLEQAELYFRRIRKAEATHPVLMEFYRDYHTRRGETPQLLALLAQTQRSEPDPEKRIRIGIEMAQLAEQRPQSAEKAIDVWKSLLRMQPGLPEAVAALRRLYTKTEKWNALLEMLKDDLEALPRGATEEKIARYLEMIPIYRDRLRLDVMVTNTFAAILSLRPDHPDALRALAERHEAHGRWADLIDVLQRQAGVGTDKAEKVRLYHRVAALWTDKLAKQQNAVGSLEKILEIEPGEETARRRLKEIYNRGRSWRPLLDLMRRELRMLPRAQHAAQLAAMAEIAADRLGQAREAIGLQNEVLEILPRDVIALAALAKLYEKEGRWAALAEILGRQAVVAGEDTPTGCELLERRGIVLMEKLGATAAAEVTLRKVHLAEPDNPRVLRALREIHALTGNYAALEALYANRGSWEELYEALTLVAERSTDVPTQIKLLTRAAEVAEGDLGQPERATKAYEKILTLRPGSRATAWTLMRLYRETERWGRLLALYEGVLEQTAAAPASDPDLAPLTLPERLSLLADARLVCEDKLGSRTVAFQWCARAYALAPGDPGVGGDLERLARDADEWAAYAEILTRRLSAGIEGDLERVDVLRRLLRVYVTRLGRVEEARRCSEQILAILPDDEEAERALARILEERKEWSGLVEIWHRREARFEDRSKKTELRFRIARAQEEELKDLPAAAGTLRSILEQDPRNAKALGALARVAETTGDMRTVAEIIRKQIDDRLSPDPLASVLRLAQLYETSLVDPDRARAAYIEAIEMDPVCPEAIAGLERLLDAKVVDETAVPDVVSRLIPYYELKEEYKKWAQALEMLVERMSAADRLGHLRTLVDLHSGPLNDTRAAFLTAIRIFELEPHDSSTRERLLVMAPEAQGLEDLMAAVRRVLERVDESGFRRELLAYQAEIDEKRPGGGAEAERVYLEILALDPLHFGAYRSLTRLYRDAERWIDLRQMLEVRQEHLPEPKERLTLLWQIAEIDEALLEDRHHAIATLQQITEVDRQDIRAYRALEKHYAAANGWKEFEALLEREQPVVPAEEKIGLIFRRAEILHKRLGQTSRALDLLEEVVSERPSYREARILLESILSLPGHRQRTATILEPLYEENGEWTKLVGVLAAQIESREGMAASTLLGRIAALEEHRLGDDTAALGTWRRVLQIEPDSITALGEVERLTGKLRRQPDLIPLYEELAQKISGSHLGAAVELLTRAAKLQVSLLGDREAAIRTWRRILELDPQNADTVRPAADALEILYAQVAEFRGFVDILRMKSDWAADDTERSLLLRRVAEIEEKSLGDLPAAVATYRSLLDANEEDPATLAELERLYERLGQQRERIDIMRRRLELSSDAGVRRDIRFRMAVILERDLEDVDEAISTALAILDENVDNVPALEMLASLYERKGAIPERLEVLERRLQLASGVEPRVEILRGMAQLLEGPLGRPQDALDRWQEVLDLQPTDALALERMEGYLTRRDDPLCLVAAQVLEPIYERAGQWSKLAGLVELAIATDEDPRERMKHRVRLARLQEERLGKPSGALESYSSAILDGLGEPQLGEMLDAYERLSEATGDSARRVVELYRLIEGDILDDQVRLRVARTLARRAEEIGDEPLASEWHRKVLERSPDDRDTLQAVERLYRNADNKPALLEILQRRSELLLDSPASEALVRLQIGALAVTLGNREDAVSAYERVLTLKPGDEEAYTALERLYTEAKQWRELCGLLDRQLGRGLPNRDAVELHQRLADIHLGELGDRNQALVHIRAALQLDQDHEPSIQKLEQLVADTDSQVAAADLLEPVYVRRNAWTKLVAIDELRLERSEDPQRRLALTQRIARVYEEQIEDLEAAFRWYGRLFRETPLDRTAQEQLLRLAPKLDRWRDVADWFARYLEQEPSNSDEVLALVRLSAIVADERLGDREAARKHYRRYVEAQPGDAVACRLYETALERWEAWQELRDLLEEHASRIPSPGDRIPYLRRSALLSAESLSDRGRAASTLRSLLDIDASDARTATDLEALLRADERWSDLRDHLLWMLEQVSEMGGDLNGIAFRLAEVEEQKLDDLDSAIDRHGEILGRMPRHAGALGALERLLGNPEQRVRAARILEPHFRRTQEWRRLADVLEVSLETQDDSDKRAEVLIEIAGLEERLGRLDRALAARGRAWLEDVSSTRNLAALEPLAASARQYEPLVEILTTGTERANDSALCAALWGMIASVREARLADAPGAIEAWRSAIAARPDDEEAFVALERLLAQAGRQNELAEVLEQHLEIVSDTERRTALTKRMAVLFEDALKNPAKAIEGWRGVLDIDESDEEALDALARLYVASSQWRALVDIYQRKIELSRDPQSLRYLRFLSARVYEEKLEEPHEAASQLRAVLDANPGDPDALAMLDRIFTREQQHIELLEVLDLRAAGAKGIEQDALALRAADLVEKLDDTSGAIARYRDILTRSPALDSARQALWRIAGAEAFRLTAVAALEPVLRAQREWAQLVELLELRLQVEETPGVRIEILTEIARIREKEQGDTRLAFDAWSAAFAEDPSEAGPREALNRLAAATGEYARLAEVYEAQLAESIDPELEQTLAWHVAGLYEERLDNPARAADFLRRVAVVPGQEVAALARLEVLLGKLGRWKELEEVLEREVEVTHDGTQQATLLASLGELRLGKLANREGSVEAFRDALSRLPTHPKALASLRELLKDVDLRREVVDILEPLAEARSDFAELAALYQVRVALESGAPERAMWWRRVAEIAETRLSDNHRALEALARSLKEDPSVPDTAEALERVAMALKQPIAAARAMEAALDQQSGGGLAELCLRSASLYERAATKKNAYQGEAERLYRRVLEEEPENARALEALEGLYRTGHQNEQLARVLEQRGAVEMDSERRRAFYAEAARLHEGLGEVEAAIAAWQAIRDNDQGNVEALEELARLLEQQGNITQLVSVLEDRARVSDLPAERASLFFRIGELRRGPLKDSDGAAAAFREVLDISAADRSALSALAALEEERGDFSALEAVLLRRLSVAEGTERVDTLLALARNAEERLSDVDRAISYLHQILETDPKSRGANERLGHLLEQNERWYDLIELHERRAAVDGGKDAELEFASRLAIAEVWNRRLGDRQSARESLDKILARKANHPGALLALAALHEQDENWGEAAAALEKAARATATPRERAEVHFRRSRVLAAQGASDTEVEAALRAALEADADHPEAARAAEERARKQGDFARLVKLLEQRLKNTPAAERKELLTEIAALYRGPLSAPDRAVAALTELSAQQPGDAQVQEELAAGLAAAGRTAEAEKLLLDLADKLGKAKQNKVLARVHRALGGLAERRGDITAALQRFEAAYQLDPAQPAVVASLGRLSLSQGNSEKARRYFRALLLQSFDEKAAGITKAEIYLALGRLHLAANELPKARNLFERGLETDPKNAELRQALASLPH